jgi:hypothetical protein
MPNLYFILWKFLISSVINNRFEENEFNSTVLWLMVTLLSISCSPLFCFVLFLGYEQRDLGGRNGI